MLDRALTIAAVSAACSLVSLAPAQEVVYDLPGSFAHSYGGTTDAFQDIDQDGFPDFLLSKALAGDVQIRSGKTGGALLVIPVANLLSEARRCGDVDGDGVEDIVLGFGVIDTNFEVAVHSGKDGSKILSAPGISGFRVRGAGDVDADGMLDVLAASEQIPPLLNVTPISTYVLSITSGVPIRSFFSSPTIGGGTHVSAAGDVDADGFDDILLGNTPLPTQGAPHSVDVVSGLNGLALKTHTFPAGWSITHLDRTDDRDGDGLDGFLALLQAAGTVQSFQARFDVVSPATAATVFSAPTATEYPLTDLPHGAALGDVDGDGIGDVGLGLAGQSTPGPGRIEVYSGADGDLLFTLTGDQNFDQWGVAVSSAGDLDGDGRCEIIGSARGQSGNGSYARVFTSCFQTTKAEDGCVGSGGISPRLRTSGCFDVGSVASIRTKDALGGSLAMLLFGALPVDVDLGAGCSLGVGLGGSILGGPFALSPGGPGAGEFELAGTVPANAASFTFHAQAFVLDPASPLGYTVTGALPIAVP